MSLMLLPRPKSWHMGVETEKLHIFRMGISHLPFHVIYFGSTRTESPDLRREEGEVVRNKGVSYN